MTGSNIVLKGKLSFLGLGELLQLLGGAGSTGVLRLTSQKIVNPGYIYISDGNPIDAEHQDKKGQDVLNTFFGWIDAEFEFFDEKVLRHKSIEKNRMELILDGLRMLDDGLIEKVGDAVPKKSSFDLKDETGIPIIKGPLVDYLYVVDEDDFAEGQEIVAQEKFGNWLWVILEGVVEVSRALPEGRMAINKLSEGAFIGSINALKEKTNIRTATVKAVTNVQLGVLDYHRILEEFTKISDTLKDVLSSIENRMVQVTTVCTEAYTKIIKLIQNMGDLRKFPEAEYSDQKIFKIVQGKAVVVKPVNNHFTRLCTLKSGDFIGNISFLSTSHEPYSAEVYTSDNFETEEIDLVDLKQEYDELSMTLKNMILHTATCLSVTSGRLVDILKNSNPQQ